MKRRLVASLLMLLPFAGFILSDAKPQQQPNTNETITKDIEENVNVVNVTGDGSFNDESSDGKQTLNNKSNNTIGVTGSTIVNGDANDVTSASSSVTSGNGNNQQLGVFTTNVDENNVQNFNSDTSGFSRVNLANSMPINDMFANIGKSMKSMSTMFQH